MAVSPRLVVADPDGQILDHPSLRMVGRSGAEVVAVPAEDLLRIPDGSNKLFTMPGSHPVAWDPRRKAFRPVPRVQIGGRRFPSNTVAAFLQPGYTRTLLPPSEVAPVVEAQGRLVVGEKGELLIELPHQEAVEALSKSLAERFGDQVLLAP